jgi:hypothetical protein
MADTGNAGAIAGMGDWMACIAKRRRLEGLYARG